MYADMVIVSKLNIEELISNSKKPVVLIFWSKNYASCQRSLKTMKSLSARYRGAVRFGVVNVDVQGELASQLGIGGLPSVIIIKNGKLCFNIGGELPLSHYKKILDGLIRSKPEKSSIFKRLLKQNK